MHVCPANNTIRMFQWMQLVVLLVLCSTVAVVGSHQPTKTCALQVLTLPVLCAEGNSACMYAAG